VPFLKAIALAAIVDSSECVKTVRVHVELTYLQGNQRDNLVGCQAPIAELNPDFLQTKESKERGGFAVGLKKFSTQLVATSNSRYFHPPAEEK
jgi:hypothetical protein